MSKKSVLSLFSLLCEIAFCQNKYEQYAKQTTAEKNNLKKVEMLCNLGFYYADSAKAMSFLNQAAALAQQENNIEVMTMVNAKKAMAHQKFKNEKKKNELTTQVVAQLKNLKNTKYTADVYYQLGRLSDDGTQGLHYYFKGLEIAEKCNDYDLATQISFNISGTYGELLKTDLMKKYVDKAMYFAKKANMFDAQIAADLSLGSYYLDVGKNTNNPIYLDSVIQVYSRSLVYIAQNEPKIVFNKNLAYLYLNLANAYLQKGIKNNENQFLEALNNAEKQGDILQSKATINNAIGLRGEYYVSQKDYPKAIQNFTHGLDIGLQNKDYRVAISFCESLLKCFDKTNDFENYKKYAALKTEYEAKQFDIATTNKIVLAEEKFENEKKSFQIKTLKQENKLKTYLFWIVLILFVSLIISGVILYRFFKTKENLSNEKQLAAELFATIKEQELQQTLYEKELTEQQKVKLKQQLLSSLQQLDDKNNLLSNVKEVSKDKSVSHIINQNLQADENYEFFRKQIVESYPSFFYKLQQQSNHALSPLDLKYCVYFLNGLETKEIANKLNVEPKSVRMTRYRIKQKLQLGEQEDLLDFIKSCAV